MSFTQHIPSIIILCIFMGITVYNFIKIKKRHDAIDSVADARVKQVINLGRGTNGKNQFAITYDVLIDAPFEVFVTPTNTPANIGEQVIIYYDSQDHNNYYIPRKWKFDPRMKTAISGVVIATVCLVGYIITLFK